jgi:hypothetical protein
MARRWCAGRIKIEQVTAKWRAGSHDCALAVASIMRQMAERERRFGAVSLSRRRDIVRLYSRHREIEERIQTGMAGTRRPRSGSVQDTTAAVSEMIARSGSYGRNWVMAM